MPIASTTPTDAHSMRAAILTGYGDADKLRVRIVPRPTPAAGQVLVRVRAVGVNDWDWGLVTGNPRISRLFQGLFRPRRTTLGLDVAGEVTDVGPGVTSFRRGDRVFGDLSSHG
ncbi:MAG TPA: alcohol dehydrogenase catalytic domain-containing protein, partial [Rhodoglobus sp.]|nr:alcohol dehydrogenase catalytic domain-containing protein [Rhodoglobus sp.]